MTDNAIGAAYRRALARAGQPVTIQRVNGTAPNTATISATVQAVVRDYIADTTSSAKTGYSDTQVGALTQGDRSVMVLEQDLVDARFPLPLKKNDKVLVLKTGAKLNVISVDASKRDLGGAVELRAAGV